ncbi:hypothetical protein [Sphingomonas qomolangmaensis]|uniref:Uncharacterized protein n=1 Tax=Sphingomonas qomolangmaensis TaxID=2918765 RepID=A0ABY5L9V8_9SPHN|nr:hypothetical protein [Sphingomonas qomolangmaensis]UUL82560.1 hypothetical protein NMP03_15540 [Sphingomonas qomolangmaensis]
MTILGQIRALFEPRSQGPVCDDCIADQLALSVRQQVDHKTRDLAGQGGFERSIDPCSLCGATKKVIRRAAR